MKDKLKNIFQSGYPGIDIFISDVLTPIFSEDSIERKNVNLIVSEEIKKRANNANIQSAYHVADIDRIDSDPIAVYDVTLKPNSKITHSRVAIKQFITALSMTYTHVFIVFHYENEPERPWRFSYVYKESTIAGTRGTAKRYTYVFGKDYHCRTAIDRFVELANSPKADADFAKAFSVEALGDEFFIKYRELYADFVQYITGKRYVKESNKWVERKQCEPNVQYNSTFDCEDKLVRDYIKKMFGRIVFLYFLQRKGWLAKNKQYMHDLYYNSEHKDNFLDEVLEPLFFEVLNTDIKYRTTEAKKLPDSDNIPYLNGGLFARDEIDELQCVFPKEYFKQLFDFLDSYNFTIDENDPEDAEVGIDPEMLGRIFENLLEDNKDKGAFYTPKEIVDYMCRESIIAYLINGIPERSHQLIRSFVEDLDAELLNDEQRIFLRKKLQAVKICDPAIGSGAFPMGLVNLLSKLYIALKSDTDTVKMKRHIMENSIYGVDIEKGAVDIARLRFWLAMIVEEKEPMPLPNLHFKIMQGNSLLESYKGIDLSDLTHFENSRDQRILDFGDDAERQDLVNKLKSYYKTSNHNERDRLFNGIKNNVLRQLYAKGITLPSDMDPSANDRFFLWHTWFADVFEKGGFDIIIGNPPYIKEYTNRNAFDGFRETSSYYQGKMDLWYGFACNGIDLLKENGVLCFIATSNWIASSGASKLRVKIRKEAQLDKFVDFGSYMIFGDSASIQTMVMLLSKKSDRPIFKTRFIRNLLENSDIINIVQLLNGDATENSYGDTEFNRADLNNLFSFSSNKITQICAKLIYGASFLNERLIAQGIIGAPDDAFVISSKEGFSKDEREYIKPYYTGLQCKYKLMNPEKYIIYLSSQNFSEEKFKTTPNFISHFAPYRSKLIESKIKFKTPNKPYFYLHRERKEYFFKKGAPRIITQGRALTPTFVYTEDECYPSRALFVITSDKFNLKYLCGILNSKVIKFWLTYKGKMQGSCFQVDKGPLLSIPIKINVKFESQLISLVDKLINLGHEDFNIEKEIDNIVYHIYELTYDEILIVDPGTPITKEEYDNFIINNEE